MRIGLIGNCMAAGTGMALRQLNNEAEIFAFEAREVLRAKTVDETSQILSSCDAVFAHPLSEEYGPLGLDALTKTHVSAYRFPTGAFTGFHPDCIYISHERKHYASPLGPYNSAIAAAAFSLGLSVQTAVRLFNGDIFRRLGYFDEFVKACTFLEREFSLCGLKVNDVLPEWMARGSFMHTINHPKGIFVAGVGKLMATKLGLVANEAMSPELAMDVLSINAIWPVYPEIADAIGVRGGSYLFKRAGGPDLVQGLGVFMDLHLFVERSFALYAGYELAVFSVPSVTRIKTVLQSMTQV